MKMKIRPGLQTIKISQNGLVWSGPKWGTEGAQIKWSGLVWSSLAGEKNGLSGVDHRKSGAQNQNKWSGLVRLDAYQWHGPDAKRKCPDVV